MKQESKTLFISSQNRNSGPLYQKKKCFLIFVMFDIFIQKIPILAQNSDPLYKKMVFFP